MTFPFPRSFPFPTHDDARARPTTTDRPGTSERTNERGKDTHSRALLNQSKNTTHAMPRGAMNEKVMTSMKMRRCAVYAPSKTLSTMKTTKENETDEICEGYVFASERCMDAEEAKAVRGARDACGGAPGAYGRARGAALCASSSSSEDENSDDHDAEILVAAHGSWILAAHGCDPAVVAERLARACSSETSSRRVEAARETLKDLVGEFKNFAVIAFDGVTKRGLAARGGDAPTVLYGHDETGALALVLGKKSSPGFDVAELKSGRFIFGHGYVKPMEFGSFWATARSSRAASPAKSAYGDVTSLPRAVRLAPNGAAAPSTPTQTRTTSGLARASPNAYVPPAMRAAAAAAAAKAEAEAAEAAEARRKSEALDRALAQTLHDEERMVSALGGALASALIKASGRSSFAADESIKEISRFHAARAHRQKIEAISSFYAPAVAAPVSDVITRRGSLDDCARASMESVRRGSLDSRLASFEASRFGAAC